MAPQLSSSQPALHQGPTAPFDAAAGDPGRVPLLESIGGTNPGRHALPWTPVDSDDRRVQ